MKKQQEGKQIRVWLDDLTFNKLKLLSDDSKIRLNLLCGLLLGGYKIIKPEKEGQ
jgi:hypothetical protein